MIARAVTRALPVLNQFADPDGHGLAAQDVVIRTLGWASLAGMAGFGLRAATLGFGSVLLVEALSDHRPGGATAALARSGATTLGRVPARPAASVERCCRPSH